MEQPDKTRSVVLLTTGGTIATTGGARAPGEAVSRPSRSGGDLLERAAAFGPLPQVEVREVASTPSWALDLPGMLALVEAIDTTAARDDVDGVVMTHGTTTLEFTAFLSDLTVHRPAPVVVTGAMRRADVPDTDGPRNLHDALVVAADPRLQDAGTLLCFDGRLLAARDAFKQHRSAVGTFTAGPGGVLGSIEDGVLDVAPSRRPRPRFAATVEERVAVVKASPGCSGALLTAAAADGARGIVLEALPGHGGVPRQMLPGLAEVLDAGVVVVVSSAAPYGQVPDPPTGGTGEVLLDLDLVSARGLRTEKAWVLLALALAQDPSRDAVREAFRAVWPG